MMDRTDINFLFSFIYFVDYQEWKNIYLCFSVFFIALAAIGLRMKSISSILFLTASRKRSPILSACLHTIRKPRHNLVL